MSQLKTQVQTETWIPMSWDGFIQVTNDPAYENVKAYYYKGRMRLEQMAALGNPHSRDHYIVIAAVTLFTSLRGFDIDGHDNCTYRKTGYTEVQPDASFYVGANAEVVPWEATIINLDLYPAPDLVIEVAYSSLTDDRGEKRLLYESLGVKEYWIVDVQNVSIWAFAVADRGSRRIDRSLVLPGLEISLLEEAFRRSREMNHGKVSAWLINQFQSGMKG
ncbi:MAG: Uma2 family endonuclease [Phormidium tanganyikae FI6-MK23]|jgi:Uma2 family endonuclease|nr:Uma2 family endonuclease [Phormidium tanganyikae FI6-MK23]